MAETPWRQTAAPPGVSSKCKPDFTDNRPEPPACVQNAMLTKDKKPFTYTPGGIDLSEIRSPRMARRLERNAMSEGVTPSPQAPHGHQRTGPLPPSALAAMQPQLPVQVFPSGKIPQLPHSGPPPPPPPPMLAPESLPLDSFARPDMTKIIPDNPMALLRKTQGPVVKQDPILNKQSYANNMIEAQQPADVVNKQIGSIYVPPVNVAQQRESPISIPAPPAFYKRQPSLQQTEPTTPPYLMQSKQAPSFDVPPQTTECYKPIANKPQATWIKQKSHSQDDPEWESNTQRPTNNNEELGEHKIKQVRPWSQKSFEKQDSDNYNTHEQANPEPRQWPQRHLLHQSQQKRPELESWQQRSVQPLEQQRPNEQTQWQPQAKQPEFPKWQKQYEPEPWQQNQQSESPITSHSPPVYTPHYGGVRQQVQNREKPAEYQSNEKIEVVIVNDPPLVLQHPGQAQRNQHHQPLSSQNQNVRIIPIQVEGATRNGHGNNDSRSLNRQLSWNSTPTQSNTFKVLQKITQTDGNSEEDDKATAYSPKMQQNFPQQNRMKLNHGDQELVNKFKQDDPPNSRGPKVRNIPIQIEGNGPNRPLVPPSEQIVPEPKKYMGSSIPSRSFKILQAMTAPDECGPGQSDL